MGAEVPWVTYYGRCLDLFILSSSRRRRRRRARSSDDENKHYRCDRPYRISVNMPRKPRTNAQVLLRRLQYLLYRKLSEEQSSEFFDGHL